MGISLGLKDNESINYIWGYKIASDGRYFRLTKAKKKIFKRKNFKILKPDLADKGVFVGTKKYESDVGLLVFFEQDSYLFFLGNRQGMKALRWLYLTDKKIKKIQKEKLFKKEIKNEQIVNIIDELNLAPGSKMDDKSGDQIPAEWLNETKKLLDSKIDIHLKSRIFLPESSIEMSLYSGFYSGATPQEGLQIMASLLFKWLDIEPNSCVVDFYDQSIIMQHGSADPAGFYTRLEIEGKEKEVILINNKIIKNGVEVAAVLCHEMMHLYLHRIGLELDDRLENELLTDLATIKFGFSVPILNGMSYSNNWWLTIILIFVGVMYWKSEQKTFGYFKPRQYAKLAKEYLSENNISVKKINGHLTPGGKHFFGWEPFQRSEKKPKFFKILSRRQWYRQGLQIGFVVLALLIFYWIGLFNHSDSSTNNGDYSQNGVSKSQINNCKQQISVMETSLATNQTQLDFYKNELNRYDASGDIYQYNLVIDKYNSLLNTYKSEYSSYSSYFDGCNNLINQYNGQ